MRKESLVLPILHLTHVTFNIILFNVFGFREHFELILSEFESYFSMFRASPGAQTAKNLSGVQEIQVQSLGWEDPLEKGMTTQFNILAWRILWTEEPGGLPSMGLQRNRHDWVTNTFTLLLCSAYKQVTWLFWVLVSSFVKWRQCQVTPGTVVRKVPGREIFLFFLSSSLNKCLEGYRPKP